MSGKTKTEADGGLVFYGRLGHRRGASLEILGKEDLNETGVEILHADGVFTLHSATGIPVARSTHPSPLAKYAWANGAHTVRHAYDLKLAGD